jgi:hypothetical protein
VDEVIPELAPHFDRGCSTLAKAPLAALRRLDLSMNLTAKGCVTVFVAAAILALGWWVLDGSTTRPRLVRSRLTLVVDTPEGERSGSSVTQETISFPGGLTKAQGWAIWRELVGETVAVDLGSRGVLFSTFESRSTLARMGGGAYNAGLVSFPQAKFGDGRAITGSNEQYASYLDNLNRIKPQAILTLEALPVMVRFGGLNDPTSVALVDPQDLAASFGPGVALKSATVQITEDPITHGIDTRLAWLRSSTEADTLFPLAYLQTLKILSPAQHLRFTDFRRLAR